MMWSLAVVGSELVPQSKPCGVSVPEDTTGHGGDRGIHEPEPIAGPCSGLSNPSVTCPVRALPCEGDGGWLGGCYESGHRKLAPMNGVCERAVDPLYGSEDCPFRDVCSTNCKSENTWYLRPTSWPTSCPRGRGRRALQSRTRWGSRRHFLDLTPHHDRRSQWWLTSSIATSAEVSGPR